MFLIDRCAISVNARHFLAGMLALIARTFFARYDFCSYDRENQAMTDGFASIITELERQKAAIERALDALKGLGGVELSAPAHASASPTTWQTNAAEVGQNRRSEGQKKRWAAKKAAKVVPSENASMGGMTPEGRQKRINEIITSQKSVTPSIALRLAKYFGMSADFWMNLQLRWDLYHTQQAESEDLNAIRPHVAA